MGLDARTFFSTCVSFCEPPTIAQYLMAYLADTVLPAPDSPLTMIDWFCSNLHRKKHREWKNGNQSIVFSSLPQRPMTSDFEGFSIPDFIHYSIFPFECSVLNKGTTGTIFIMSLVWRGAWLGIEPRTSRTRSQHSTTRLSRRRLEGV